MAATLSPQDFDELHDFVQLRVAAGYSPVEEIVDEALEWFAEATTDVAALREAAGALAEQAVAAHRSQQSGWPQRTDCDRLDAAFAELDVAGIVARQHFSCCGTCGADEIFDEIRLAEKAGRPARGFTFFHMQDTEHAIAGEGLYLSYGSASRDREEAVAIGHEVVAALTRQGLVPSWNGKFAHRIALPVVWQRRRPAEPRA